MSESEAAWFNKAVLMRPRRLSYDETAWNGHIPFAAWAVAVCKPRVLVELGIHLGVSFGAFCQAVEENGTQTQCFAVDTWQGELHAGRYNEAVYDEVAAYFGKTYPETARLLRTTFDNALSQFADGTVDLLHIDGLHSYEAVKHDFETWLPKMSGRGVILFHDTVVRDHDFGVWQLWAELEDRYPSIEFGHSHGLGVLFLGKDSSPEVRSMVEIGQQGQTSPVKRFFERVASDIQAPKPAEVRKTWLDTTPVRAARLQLGRARMVGRALPGILKMGGGPVSAARKAVKVLQNEGWSGVMHRVVLGDLMSRQGKFLEWVAKFDTIDQGARDRLRGRIERMPARPLISIIMPVYNPNLEHLEQAIRSVRDQLYPEWQLCIADDASTDARVPETLKRLAMEEPRISLTIRDRNGHISHASNSAIELAKGPFIALLDHDDLLREHALFCLAQVINSTPDAGLIYSDEDKIDEQGRRLDPYFKPDFNPELMLGHNMINHLAAYRTSLVRELGGFRAGFEGAQDYDLAWRCIEKLNASQIVHIPRVLYHWRKHAQSTAAAAVAKPYAFQIGERVLNEHFTRIGSTARATLPAGETTYRINFPIPKPLPLVSILIPTRNALELIQRCVDSIVERSTYPAFEIIIIDNGSDDPATLAYFDGLKVDTRIQFLRDNGPFNFSILNNKAVEIAKGELICLLNNDTEIITPGWLEEMIGLAILPEIGAVGAKLLYPNNTLQHGGVVLGILGAAGHGHKYAPRTFRGKNDRAALLQNFSAVTAACLMVRKSVYREVGGLDEGQLRIGYGDVDFCLKIGGAGYRNVWTPHAELYHHESATRGHDLDGEKKARFHAEIRELRARWKHLLDRDPYYNPNLTLEREDFSLGWPPRVDPL
jgi:glycosyltransferase involved in cell wall biosynthesis